MKSQVTCLFSNFNLASITPLGVFTLYTKSIKLKLLLESNFEFNSNVISSQAFKLKSRLLFLIYSNLYHSSPFITSSDFTSSILVSVKAICELKLFI